MEVDAWVEVDADLALGVVRLRPVVLLIGRTTTPSERIATGVVPLQTEREEASGCNVKHLSVIFRANLNT